ncbi:MAG: N-acetylglucosamine-6-phosphate deacetylase [Planctomycetota bacterium]
MKDRGILIKNGALITPEGILPDTDLLIKGTKISRIGKALLTRQKDRKDIQVVDAFKHYVSPGLIDIHIHGADGVIFGVCDREEINRVTRILAKYGVTGFLPTIQSLPSKTLMKALERLKDSKDIIDNGAEMLGVHLEGPMINPARAGAHKKEYLRNLRPQEISRFQKVSGGLIKLMTLAPELPGAMKIIRHLRKCGIISAAGHSEASFQQMQLAIQNGLTHIIHLYNAMRGIHHRQPGILESALLMDELSVEIICDGIHLALPAIQLVLKCKPLDKIILITDSVGLNLDPGNTFRYDKAKYIVKDGAVWIKKTGKLGGSSISLLQAVKNLTQWIKLPLYQIIRMASLNPARIIGLDKRIGSLEPGKDATLLILDKQLNVRETFIRGRSVWKS